jgi:toxin ParE1/3/4
MPGYRLSSGAQLDLIEIRQFTIQQWGISQSKKYLSELRKIIHLLADTPSLGKPRPDAREEMLSFLHANHVIYYVIHERQLVIFGVQ